MRLARSAHLLVYNTFYMEHKQLNYYRLSAEEALEELQTQREGLSEEDARTRLQHIGRNELAIARHELPVIKFLRQFWDPMIMLLLASSLISQWLGDGRTAIVLLALVLFNTTIGFLQEYKAERVMESLEKLVVDETTVVREGETRQIAATELVLGDIVYIEEGDSVPADLRLIEESELSTNDFALTGESQPSRKFVHVISAGVPLAGRHNLAFMGTTVATGHGYGVVIATGMYTELGRIANLSQDTMPELSPLQKEMNHIAARVTEGTIILCAVLLPIAIKADLSIKDAFLFAIGIASSIIPQGLPAEINTALAQAAGKLARARALVKKLSAVETLGATSVICTDKTGTLTKNQMTVEQLTLGRTSYLVTGSGYEPDGSLLDSGKEPLTREQSAELALPLVTAVFASNARVEPPDDEHADWYCIGDPTEGALMTLAAKAGLDTARLNKDYPELKEFTFDSARKRMSSIRRYGDSNQLYVFAKGAPESILEKCQELWDHGHVRPLTAKDRERILQENEQLADQAMRNLALAYRILPPQTVLKKQTIETVESGLVWLGVVSMIDPLREQVPSAMMAARNAHIRVSIVTGDNARTATAIAVRARLADRAEDIQVVDGDALQALSDLQVLALARRGRVIFSRVAPEDKLRIVTLVQKAGHVVAVTGDGINDAPALKRADIGVAMGKSGTDVAKQSAEIVLLDDSFHTLVSAIQQGRTVFQNIKKGTLSCFTSNAAELVVNLASLGAMTLFHIPLALSVMEILAIDLIAELFPIAALGWDKADGDLMAERPRKLHDHILNRSSVLDLLWCGLLIGGLSFANYLWFFHRAGLSAGFTPTDSDLHFKATALTYVTIVLCQLVNILERRSSRGLFTRYQLHNKQLWFAYALSLFFVVNIIYNPLIAPYFRTGPLSFIDWLYALAAAAIFVGVREFQRYSKQHSRKSVLSLHQELSLNSPPAPSD